MRACIRRGAHEIGGSCVEIVHGSDRLVLDLGRPLSAPMEDHVPLPDVPGLRTPDPSLRGVVITHAHLDHFGLAHQLSEDVPVFLGEEAQRVLEAASFFSPAVRPPAVYGHLRDREPFELGPFTVTPYLADHSAFDAYSLHVHAGGRRLFYTGDIRAHGRKGKLFERLVSDPPPAHVLLMEGTHIRADDGQPDDGPSESDVERELAATMTATGGLVAILASAQNIDRLVTAYRAAKRAGRTLVVDLYTATVAMATGRDTIPQPGFDRLAVYVPARQRARIVESRQFDRIAAITDIRRFPEDLASDRGRAAFFGTSSTTQELVDAGALHGGAVVWSLWDGYLDEPSGRRLRRLLDEAEVPLVIHHTSGHAYPRDLRRLVDAFADARIVPIHSEAAHRFPEHFPRVEPHADGEWWDV